MKRQDRSEETLAEIARSYNVTPATISRLPLDDEAAAAVSPPVRLTRGRAFLSSLK